MKGRQSFEVLLSCMNHMDFKLAEKSKIDSDLLIVNQCTSDACRNMMPYQEKIGRGQYWKKYNLQEKGLSKSRNYAIKHSKADICLIADDDEIFEEGYREKILEVFEKYHKADIVIFHFRNQPKRVKKTFHLVRFPEVLRVSSWQIAFRRKKLLEKNIWFDERMGAGTGNGAEEEVKFLIDCLKAKLSILNAPIIIGELEEGSTSTWFSGMNAKFFENRGMTTRYMLGRFWAVMYGIYYIIAKKALYKRDISMCKAWKALMRGISENRLEDENG